MSALPEVHVLLATYNGKRYLEEQWRSLERQAGVSVVVHAADDGSDDGTLTLLRDLAAARTGSIRAVRYLDLPPRRSAARSFLLLLEEAVRSHPEGEWFAYCDQDDVWLPGKLQAAVTALAPFAGNARPALYAGRSIAIDPQGRECGVSRLFPRPPSFRNALVQNIMAGNTMLMNRAAAELVARSSLAQVTWHDWLTYQLVSGCEGAMFYDPCPFLQYRQHGGNVMGSNLRWRARLGRLLLMLRGEFRHWNGENVRVLSACEDVVAANGDVLDAFSRAREAHTPWARLLLLRRSGAFRQQRLEQLMLWLACAMRRM